MSSLSKETLEQLFSKARTHNQWQPRDIDEQTLHQIYDLMKWGPTSANLCPGRIVFVKSKTEKEKLISCLPAMNVEKVRTAPVTAIIAMDEKFYEHAAKLFPHAPGVQDAFVKDPVLTQTSALRNSSLQGAYFILACRALGLDCGPMSGFDNKKVDDLFLAGTSWKSNFICNVGYGDASKQFPRLPRLSFAEACKVI